MSPCDLLLIEGYKYYPLPKLEIYREANGKPPLHPEDPHIVAMATDVPLQTQLPAVRPRRLRCASRHSCSITLGLKR